MYGLIVALASPVALWCIIRLSLPSARVEMDFDQTHGTFLLLYQNYARIAEGIFLAGLVVFIKDGSNRIGLAFLTSAVYSLLFRVWLLNAYESYMHTKYPKGTSPNYTGPTNYGPGKYAATLALAASSILSFIYAAVVSR